MSSSTWRVLSGYAIYQRTPIIMTSGGKCAPLKLIAIVVLPHEVPLVIEGDHTANGLKGKLATNPTWTCWPVMARRGRPHVPSRELILRAALDPAIASKARKGAWVKCLDHFDLLQTAIN